MTALQERRCHQDGHGVVERAHQSGGGYSAFSSYLETKGLVNLPQKEVYNNFKSMTAVAFKEFTQRSPVHYVTVGSRDILFLPAAAIFHEKVWSQGDCLGFRFQYIRSNDLEHLEAIDRMLMSHSKPNELLRQVCTVLNREDWSVQASYGQLQLLIRDTLQAAVGNWLWIFCHIPWCWVFSYTITTSSGMWPGTKQKEQTKRTNTKNKQRTAHT